MHWIASFFAGVGTGVVLSLMLGTVFFALINSSVNYGFKTGISIAIGVILSDIIFISVCIFFSQYIPEIQRYEFEVKVVGGCLLILLGISQAIQKNGNAKVLRFSRASSIAYFMSQGFLLNFLNPVNLISWFAINTYLISVRGYTQGLLIIFFVGCLLSIFCMEVLLAYSANKVKKHLKEQTILRMNQIIGLLFIALGIWLIIK